MSFTLEKAQNIIYYIEENFPVEEWEINSLKVWPLIRIKLNYHLSYLSLGLDVNNSIQSRSKKALIKQVLVSPFKWLYYSLSDLNHNRNLFKQSDVIFLSSPTAMVKVEDKWVDKFCDPLAEIFDHHKLTNLRLDTSHTYRQPRANKSFYFQTLLDVTISLSILKFRFDKADHKLDKYNEFLNYIKNSQLSNIDLSIPTIAKQTYKLQFLKKMYTTVLKIVKPQAVMTVCYYDDICMSLIWACKQQKIPTFDIQHGIQGEKHGAYGNWLKVPLKGYDVVPDYFICWGKTEADAITKWSSAIKTHKPIITGNIFLQSWLAGNFDRLFEKQFNEIFKSTNPKILITLGWDLADEVTLAENIISMKETQDKYFYLIRLHPSMLHQKNEVRAVFEKNGVYNFEIDNASELPLYFIMKNIDCHITHSSTTAIEASEFNVPTIITSDYGWRLFNNNEKLVGYIYKCITSVEITTGIATALTQSFIQGKKDMPDGSKQLLQIIKKKDIYV